MASLANVTPGASYPGLIKTIDNLALTTCSQLSDGCGNALPISISAQKNSVSLGSTTNISSGCFSTILGGTGNCALGIYSIAQGNSSCAINDYGVAMGFRNTSIKTYGFVFGACNTNDSPNSFNLSTISGGYLNYNCSPLSFIGSGISNRIEGGSCNVLVGGEQNCIVKLYPGVIASNFIGAGRYNKILAAVTNCVDSIHSTIAGGCGNVICGSQFGTIPGGAFNRVDNAAQVVVGGGISAGGAFNIVSSDDGSILAGRSNTVTGCKSSIIGGIGNNVSGFNSGIFNGCGNIVSSCYSSVLGGSSNTACLPYSAVFNGCCNVSAGSFSSVLAGANNCAIGDYSTIFGGQLNSATCANSGVFGCGITSRMSCAFHTNRIVVTQLPSSSAGLPSGAMWYDPAAGNVVKYVP
jgi:hypothetical protein